MQKLLLLGEFTAYRNYLSSLPSCQLLHCHSLSSLQNEYNRGSVSSLLLAPGEWKPSSQNLLQKWGQEESKLRWILILPQFSPSLEAQSNTKGLILTGPLENSWAAVSQRWLIEGSTRRRYRPRYALRGGLRLKASEFSKTSAPDLKSFLKISDLSESGVGLLSESRLPWHDGEILEASLSDSQGQLRTYFGQIRWQKSTPNGGSKLGFQFLAAA